MDEVCLLFREVAIAFSYSSPNTLKTLLSLFPKAVGHLSMTSPSLTLLSVTAVF